MRVTVLVQSSVVQISEGRAVLQKVLHSTVDACNVLAGLCVSFPPDMGTRTESRSGNNTTQLTVSSESGDSQMDLTQTEVRTPELSVCMDDIPFEK